MSVKYKSLRLQSSQVLYANQSSSHNSNAIPLNAPSILYRSVLTGAKEMRIKVTQFSSSSVYLLVPFRGQEMDISFFLCAFTLGPLTPHHYGFCNLYSFTKILKRWFIKRYLFSNFSFRFLNPKYFFFQLQSNLAIRNFLVALKMFLNAKGSLSL